MAALNKLQAQGDEKEEAGNGKRGRSSGETINDGGDNCTCRKRQRFTNNVVVLRAIKDRVRSCNIRLFKWNETLLKKGCPDGIIIIRLKQSLTATTLLPDGKIQEDQGTEGGDFLRVGLFNPQSLQCIRHCFVNSSVVQTMLADTFCFGQDVTIEALANEVALYLASNFRFTQRTLLSGPRTRRLVVYVQVDLLTTYEQDVIGLGKDLSVSYDEEEEDDDRQEEELIEDELVQELVYDQESRQVADEEIFIEAEEDDMKDEEHYSDSEENEDFSGVVSDPELMAIPAMIWTGLKTTCPECIQHGRHDFLHNSKGFKQVKDAMEIIKEFRGNDEKEEVDSCPLCLEVFSEEAAVARTQCWHLFHRNCLSLWLSEKDSCPLCRSSCATLV